MKFVPALRYDALTPVYDVVTRLALPEIRFKEHLIRAASIGRGSRVLDVGCGTGTLLVLARQAHPEAEFAGIDPDARVLSRARRKAPGIRFEQASATALPFGNATFDRVFSTLMFHHLDHDGRRAATREILRVLQKGGEFHLGDFGQPDTRMMRIASFLTQMIGREHTDGSSC